MCLCVVCGVVWCVWVLCVCVLCVVVCVSVWCGVCVCVVVVVVVVVVCVCGGVRLIPTYICIHKHAEIYTQHIQTQRDSQTQIHAHVDTY